MRTSSTTPTTTPPSVRLPRLTCARAPMRVVGYCLLPNHYHLVLWPPGGGDLSSWMQWLLTAHPFSC